MDFSGYLILFLVLILMTGIAGGICWYTQFWQPKLRAFRDGLGRVPIWFGQGEMVFWNPGQTFAFLKNKQLHSVGDAQGGFRAVYPYRGEQAIGPIQLQSALFNWEDASVLTRDGQNLAVKVGVWWKVVDAEKYIFHIYSDPSTDLQVGNTLGAQAPAQPRPGSGVAAGSTGFGYSQSAQFNTSTMHRIADQWLRVITESTIRAKINSLAVSEVVSAQAMQFLRQAMDGNSTIDGSATTTFEAAILTVLSDIQRKALEFGVGVERLEVQHIHLPQEIQDAITETRIAFLAPIKGEQEAEAIRIKLEKLSSVLGKDTVGLNEIMKNFQHANFLTPATFMQPIFDKVTQRVAQVPEPKRLEDS
jgi:regulator of protease activity HflC (stomatin/prohibitin superfamily)